MEIYSKSNYQIAADLGTRFKNYRIALRMTQKEISEKSGVSVMTVVRFENGECGTIRLDNLIALMRAIEQLEPVADLLPDIPESLYSSKTEKEVKRIRKRKDER